MLLKINSIYKCYYPESDEVFSIDLDFDGAIHNMKKFLYLQNKILILSDKGKVFYVNADTLQLNKLNIITKYIFENIKDMYYGKNMGLILIKNDMSITIKEYKDNKLINSFCMLQLGNKICEIQQSNRNIVIYTDINKYFIDSESIIRDLQVEDNAKYYTKYGIIINNNTEIYYGNPAVKYENIKGIKQYFEYDDMQTILILDNKNTLFLIELHSSKSANLEIKLQISNVISVCEFTNQQEIIIMAATSKDQSLHRIILSKNYFHHDIRNY